MLPEIKTKPKVLLWDYVLFMYGVPKIGKSTLVSEIDDVIFLNTGGGLDALEVYQIPILTWGNFLTAGQELLSTKHRFKVIAIDTVDALHKLAVNYVVQQQKIAHPSDLSYGKGYDMVKDEFIRPLTKLALSHMGVVLISHARDVEIQTRTAKYTRAVPTVQGHIWDLIDGITSIIMYFTSEITEKGERRVIRVSPSERWVAGDRTGRLARYGDIEIINDRQNWKRIQEMFEKE